MYEVDWIGGKFAKDAARGTSLPAAGIEAVGATFRAVERELGRELETP